MKFIQLRSIPSGMRELSRVWLSFTDILAYLFPKTFNYLAF